MDAIPADLNSDAEEHEGDDAQDAVGSGWGDTFRDFWCVGVAEEYQDAEGDDGEEDGRVGEYVFAHAFHRGVRAEGEHDHDAAGIDGDRECEWVEDFFAELAVNGAGNDVGCGGGLRVLLVEQAPSHGSEDEASGDLDHRERDSKKSEEGRADQFNDQKEEYGADGDGAGEVAIYGIGGGAYEAEEDEGRSERIDNRQKGAEGEREEFEERGSHGAQQNSIG